MGTLFLLLITSIVSQCNGRDIITSLKAPNWPTTLFSPVCEAHMYWQAVAKSYKNSSRDYIAREFIEVIIEKGVEEIQSYDDMIRYVVDVSNGLNGVSKFEILSLEYSLALREFSPVCELHRRLADKEFMNKNGKLDPYKPFIQVMSTCLNTTLDVNQVQEIEINKVLAVDCKSHKVDPLTEDEIVWKVKNAKEFKEGNDSARATLLFYGKIGTSETKKLYDYIFSNLTEPIDIIIRHMVRIMRNMLIYIYAFFSSITYRVLFLRKKDASVMNTGVSSSIIAVTLILTQWKHCSKATALDLIFEISNINHMKMSQKLL